MPFVAVVTGILATQVGAEMTPQPGWFVAKWQSSVARAFEGAAAEKKPVMIWVPERTPFGLQADSSLTARETILSSAQAFHMVQSRQVLAAMHSVGTGTTNSTLDKILAEPGAYVFFPNGKLAKKLPSPDLGAWSEAALEVQDLLAKTPAQWTAPAFIPYFVCNVIDMTPKKSLWCRRSGSRYGEQLGYQLWTDRDGAVMKFVEDGEKKRLLPFVKQFFIDSTRPSPSAWKDREVEKLEVVVLRPGLRVMVEFEMKSEDGSRGMKGRALFSRTELKYSPASVSGQATSWLVKPDGSKEGSGISFMSGPLFKYRGEIVDNPRGVINIRPSKTGS